MKKRITISLMLFSMLLLSAFWTTKQAEAKTSSKVRVIVIDPRNGEDAKRVKGYLEDAGCTAVIKTHYLTDADVKNYDGMVIPGGYSVTPTLYGGKKYSNTKHFHYSPIKYDKIQINAVKKFRKAKKPVLGICRGCQIINVAYGGTLKQCLGWPHTHYGNVLRTTIIDKSSWLYNTLGAKRKTKHYHHQNVEKLGKGLVATMWDLKDGNIEGIEDEKLPIYGVQWHCDRSYADNTGKKVFKKFYRICKYYKK